MQDLLAILQHFALPWSIVMIGLGIAVGFALSAFVCHRTAETIEAE